ncbi:MAG: dethiobiotin synthase [Leptospiraceae bacterium]|nr:dethiobiotin synthase [Leptospiraceae bacterium]
MSVIITATGTDTGKTILSALILAKYGESQNLKYWKPIQTGRETDAGKVKSLAGIHSDSIRASLYHFYFPASPHYSAYFEMEKIDTGLVVGELKKIKDSNYIVEGAGGVLVPITDDELQADVFAESGIGTIVVCQSELGTINHSLLTIEALQKRSVPVLGFYIYGKDNDLVENNISTITKFSKTPCLGKIFVPNEVRDSSAFKGFAEENFDKEGKVKKVVFG